MSEAKVVCDDAGFPLFWTVGFSGNRFLRDEQRVHRAIDQALADLCAKAKAAGAKLTAVSSLARGGDVLFAEACQEHGIRWRCLLPFRWEDFIALDLDQQDARGPLSETERGQRLARAERLRVLSFAQPPLPIGDESGANAPNVFPDPAVVSHGVVISDEESRDSAYQDCSYRTVDEADVMICVLGENEFAELVAAAPRGQNGNTARPRAGTRPTALYAKAAKRPLIVLNADAADPWVSRKIHNDPDEPAPLVPSHGIQTRGGWFVDPIVTTTFEQALRFEPEKEPPGDAAKVKAWESETRQCVWNFSRKLGSLANHHRDVTKGGHEWILRLHLLATFIAALCVTFLAYDEDHSLPPWLLVLSGLAGAKALFVGLALLLERHLHRREHRDRWLNARVLAEFCRSAVATWPLPLQPLDASDEEDFPRLKRLIRTLRLMRALDPRAAVTGTPRQSRETSLEANMRVACDDYRRDRLLQQAAYYGKGSTDQQANARKWRLGFKGSLYFAIVAGLLLAAIFAARYFSDAEHAQYGGHGLIHWAEKALEAVLIMSPFIATYALGRITINDSRRRVLRYGDMRHHLLRLADTLANCNSNPSRLRLVEHAERMLIEEQHEWFSAVRNANI